LYVVKDIKVGDEFSHDNVRSIRPGFGIAPKYLCEVLSKKAKVNISRGTALTWQLIE
jgi:sialic acid synthase SpsE